MSLNQQQQEKALRHLGYFPGGQVGSITIEGQPVSAELAALLPQALADAEEKERITAIKSEANKRVDAITGGQVQVNQDVALALARMYADLKAQGLLQITTIETLDPLFAKQASAKAIRLHEAAMIQDPTLNWPE